MRKCTRPSPLYRTASDEKLGVGLGTRLSLHKVHRKKISHSGGGAQGAVLHYNQMFAGQELYIESKNLISDRVSVIAGLYSARERGTGMWDWVFH